ncbi:probable blue-light-inducible Bli-3 [Lecanosticta acicola]|uniref:Probable blue-light-inducible Bli-3 n=1 Tax=Lecanosticta acicola TaxID=111012 RepID=A0AAI8YUZ4_9PEZI|nr:probable blue-light-inducible Bli-3 [Lecanosticta acicola]
MSAQDPYTQKNLEEPSLKEKVEDLTQFIDRAKFSMLTTHSKEGVLASRCMAVAGKEGNGVDLIYHTNNESGKTDDLATSPDVNVAFLDSSGEWASISGKATVETDRAKVKEYYSPLLKAWLGDLGDGKHDGGPEDPRIGLIKVKAETIQYAVSRRNFITSTIDVVKGAVTGEVPAINKLRHLGTEEIQQWRASA